MEHAFASYLECQPCGAGTGQGSFFAFSLVDLAVCGRYITEALTRALG